MFPIEVFRDTVQKFVHILEQLKIPYHLTGGVTSLTVAAPRLTQDIDIIFSQSQLSEHLDEFIEAITAVDFLFDVNSLRKAVTDGKLFQLLDRIEVLKIDVYPRELVPGELSRSRLVEVFTGLQLPMVSAADAAVSKLFLISKGSHKSREDLRQIFRTLDNAEREAVQQLANQLELDQLLTEVLNEETEIRD